MSLIGFKILYYNSVMKLSIEENQSSKTSHFRLKQWKRMLCRLQMKSQLRRLPQQNRLSNTLLIPLITKTDYSALCTTMNPSFLFVSNILHTSLYIFNDNWS